MFFPQQTQTQGPLGQMQSQLLPPIFPIFPFVPDQKFFAFVIDFAPQVFLHYFLNASFLVRYFLLQSFFPYFFSIADKTFAGSCNNEG